MNDLESKLTSQGLRVWEKGNVKRFYVKENDIKTLINFEEECNKNSYLEKNTKAIFQRINKDGAWLNCLTGKMESKKATVQHWFENSEFSHIFGY